MRKLTVTTSAAIASTARRLSDQTDTQTIIDRILKAHEMYLYGNDRSDRRIRSQEDRPKLGNLSADHQYNSERSSSSRQPETAPLSNQLLTPDDRSSFTTCLRRSRRALCNGLQHYDHRLPVVPLHAEQNCNAVI